VVENQMINTIMPEMLKKTVKYLVDKYILVGLLYGDNNNGVGYQRKRI
jgi:hypothetical protein